MGGLGREGKALFGVLHKNAESSMQSSAFSLTFDLGVPIRYTNNASRMRRCGKGQEISQKSVAFVPYIGTA